MRPTRALALVVWALASLLAGGCAVGSGAVPDGGRNASRAPAGAPGSDGLVEAGAPDLATPAIVELPEERFRVLLDPYGVAPLSALVVVEGVEPACVRTVSVAVGGRDGDDLEVTLPHDEAFSVRYACPEHVGPREFGVPVLGLYPDYRNSVRIELAMDATIYRLALEIRTAALDERMPTVDIAAREIGSMEPGWNLAAFSIGEGAFLPRPFVFDLYGRIRWVLRVDEAISPGFVTPMEPLRDGNLLLAIGGALYEYSLLGREVARWLLPDGFSQHHDVSEMPDGGLLVCARSDDTPIITAGGDELRSSEDQVVELDRLTGAVRNIWDLRRFLDIDRYTYMKTDDGHDWYHLNAVSYSPEDDTIIVSGKHQGVAKITRGGVNTDDPYRGKQLRWILAPHLGWERAGFNGRGVELAPYLLTAVDADGAAYPAAIQDGTESTEAFGWAYGQHAPALLPDGSLLLFDNGWGRDLHRYRGESFSRGVRYAIAETPDGVGGTVRQLWEYGRERGADLYAPVISDVDVGRSTGNLFVIPGSYTTGVDGVPGGTAKMVEIAPPLDHPDALRPEAGPGQVVFEAQVRMNGEAPWGDDICYRMERMSLYMP